MYFTYKDTVFNFIEILYLINSQYLNEASSYIILILQMRKKWDV